MNIIEVQRSTLHARIELERHARPELDEEAVSIVPLMEELFEWLVKRDRHLNLMRKGKENAKTKAMRERGRKKKEREAKEKSGAATKNNKSDNTSTYIDHVNGGGSDDDDDGDDDEIGYVEKESLVPFINKLWSKFGIKDEPQSHEFDHYDRNGDSNDPFSSNTQSRGGGGGGHFGTQIDSSFAHDDMFLDQLGDDLSLNFLNDGESSGGGSHKHYNRSSNAANNNTYQTNNSSNNNNGAQSFPVSLSRPHAVTARKKLAWLHDADLEEASGKLTYTDFQSHMIETFGIGKGSVAKAKNVAAAVREFLNMTRKDEDFRIRPMQ